MSDPPVGLIQNILRWLRLLPSVTVIHDADFPLTAATINIVVRLQNPYSRPIRIRYLLVHEPESFAAGEAKVNGSRVGFSVLRPSQNRSGLRTVHLDPDATLSVPLTLFPDNGFAALISWRFEGARAWWGIPLSVRRSGKTLIEMAGDKYDANSVGALHGNKR